QRPVGRAGIRLVHRGIGAVAAAAVAADDAEALLAGPPAIAVGGRLADELGRPDRELRASGNHEHGYRQPVHGSPKLQPSCPNWRRESNGFEVLTWGSR